MQLRPSTRREAKMKLALQVHPVLAKPIAVC